MAENNRQKRKLVKTTMSASDCLGQWDMPQCNEAVAGCDERLFFLISILGAVSRTTIKTWMPRKHIMTTLHRDAGFVAIDIDQRRCVCHVPPQCCTIHL